MSAPTAPKQTTLLERGQNALSKGGMASFATTMITGTIWHPVVTVMVRQQFAGAVDSAKQYSGVVDAFRSISKEGVRAFYRGLGPRLCQSPLAAVQWTTYEMFRDVVAHKNASTLDAAKYALLFAGSRGLVTFIKCPFEIVKERMQVEASLTGVARSRSSFDAVRTLVSRDGVKGLWQGLWANLARDLPVVCLMMSGNDFYTHLLTSGSLGGFWDSYFAKDKAMRQKGQSHPAHISLLAGALSGATTTLLTQPIDVAKTIIQTQSMSRLLPGAPAPKYRGVIDVLATIRRERGLRFWFTGMTTRGAHIMLGGSVYLAVYRALQKQLATFGKPAAAH
jgi:hypothetical protein